MKTKNYHMIAIALLAACANTRDTKNGPRANNVSPMSQSTDGKGMAWSGPTKNSGATNSDNTGNGVGSDTNKSATFSNDQTGSNTGTNSGSNSGAMNNGSNTGSNSGTYSGSSSGSNSGMNSGSNSGANNSAAPVAHSDVKITPLYKNSMLIDVGGKTIYVNPGLKATENQKKADLILFTEMPEETIADTFFGTITTPSAVIYAPKNVSDKYPGKMKVISTGKKETWKSGGSAGDITIESINGNGYVLTVNKEHVYLSGDPECFAKITTPKNLDTKVLSVGKTTVSVPGPEEEVVTCLNASK
jgi:hypothetical protein